LIAWHFVLVDREKKNKKQTKMRMRRVGYGRSALLDWVQLAYSAQTLQQLTKYN
jgi:hypothetical protein